MDTYLMVESPSVQLQSTNTLDGDKQIRPEDKQEDEKDHKMGPIVLAAAIGTVIEYYDFFIYGTLSTTLASKFYRTGTTDGDLIYWLGSYAVGFLFRPFGGLIFGAMGDLLGRKITFLITLLTMGLCSFLIGCIPTLEGEYSIGPLAGYFLIFLRILQGLALGGEFGGAAIYIGEYAPFNKRGYYTSFIMLAAASGLTLSLMVLLVVRLSLGETAFVQWGWRIPFWLSIILVVVSLKIRLQMKESPIFQRLKDNGGGATSASHAIKLSFFTSYNLKYVMMCLFGAAVGQGAVFFTSAFYTLTFTQAILKTPLITSYLIVGIPLLLSAPFGVLFGYLSDKFGRKPFMLLGMVCSVLAWYPAFIGLHHFGPFVDPRAKPLVANDAHSPLMMGLIIFVLDFFTTLLYAPLSAFMIELFPTNIRYTSLSVPYNLGVGIVGGLVPVVAISMTSLTGNIYSSLWFPMFITTVCMFVNFAFVPETFQTDIECNADDNK